MHFYRKKPKREREDTSGEIHKGVAEVIEAQRIGPNKNVNVLSIEDEDLDYLELDLLGLKAHRKKQTEAVCLRRARTNFWRTD